MKRVFRLCLKLFKQLPRSVQSPINSAFKHEIEAKLHYSHYNTRMRFIAVIPNYNHGESLVRLLDQLLKEDFDAIFVLDDASSDNCQALLKPYKDKVKIIYGPFNVGPGGNRNRIIPHLKPGDIVMFVDADMQLVATDIKPKVTKLFEANPKVALFGGGIQEKNGHPMTYNYGLHQSQFRHGVGISIEKITKFVHLRFFAKLIRPLALKFTYNVEIAFFKPVERVVLGSVSEGHFYVRGDVFKDLGGFNEELRYHEGDEFGYRLRQAGHIIMFTPEVWTRHLEIHSRKSLRTTEAKKLSRIIKEEAK